MPSNHNLPAAWLIRTAAWLHTNGVLTETVALFAAVCLVLGGRLL